MSAEEIVENADLFYGRAKSADLCFVYAQLYDDSATHVLAETKYSLHGIETGKIITGTTDEQGMLRHDSIPDDHYELESCGNIEIVEVYYMSEKGEYGTTPWILRMRGVKR
jgi:hypothetical protein